MLLFNFKAKTMCNRSPQRPDLLTLLSYCLRHLEGSGYLVFGDYFERGELPTFLALFAAYQLRVAEQEELTRNIDYARKLTRLRSRNPCEERVEAAVRRAREWAGQSAEEREFHVVILERGE